MKPQKLKLVLFALICLFLASCSNEDDGIYFNEITEVEFEYTSMELEILDLINKHRIEIGLQTLKDLNIISSVALSHSEYMVEINEVNHDYFPERQENLVLKANAKSVGENVAYGYTTSQGVVNAWLNSDGHRAIIENKKYTHFGISIEKNSEGKNYFTQMFINQ